MAERLGLIAHCPARRAVLLLAIAALAGCFPFNGLVHDEVLVGPYHLVAVDAMEDMALAWAPPDSHGNYYVGDGLPGSTVFAAGYDARVLVVARHPPICPDSDLDCTEFGMRRNVTEYWVIIRQPDEGERHPYAGIRGPFGAARFAELKLRHNLPDFSVRFTELE